MDEKLGQIITRSDGLSRRRFMECSIAGAALMIGSEFTASAFPQPQKLPSQEDRRNLVVNSWRTVESGFHNGPTVTFDQLNPEQYMESVRDAQTEVVIVQTKSHWGYAYYETKVGVRHPNLHYDLIARFVQAAHRHGLAVVAYYSGQVDTQSGIKYPFWMGRNADQSLSWVDRHWAWCCHNSPYHEYALGMYKEIFTQYDLDGLFIDGLPAPRWLPDPLCYCEWCMSRYEKDAGESLLKNIEEPEEYRKRLKWLQESAETYFEEVSQIVHAVRPGLPIWFNQGDPFDMPSSLVKKASSPYIEPISSPAGVAVGAITLRDWGGTGPQVGIFWPGYDQSPLEVDQFRTAAVMLQGVRPRFITDQQNMPDGRQRPGFFAWCKQLQMYVEKVEPLLQNLRPINSLGVLFSEATRDYLAAHNREGLMSPQDLHDSLVGCIEILTRTQYPIGIIPDRDLSSDRVQQYDLIAMPECDALTEPQGEALKDYVKKGGKLLASWKPGLADENGRARSNFLLADVLGVRYVEEVKKYAGKDGPGIYLRSTGHPLSKMIDSGMVALLAASSKRDPAYCPFVKVHGPAENLADYRLPYLVPNLDEHILDSWNPAPPGNGRIPQAATYYRFGEGESVYIGIPIFRRYQRELYWIDTFIRGVVRHLVPDPAIRVEGDIAVQATFYQQGTDRLVVQLLDSSVWLTKNRSETARSVTIIGRFDRFKARSARQLWPETKRAPLIRNGGHWHVSVPGIALYTIIDVQLE